MDTPLNKKSSDQSKEDMSIREEGKAFYERLKKQGPTLDRIGQSFVVKVKKK